MLKKAMLVLVAVTLLAGTAVYAGMEDRGYSKLPDAWEAAYNSGEAAAVAAMYAEDGKRMPPDMPIVEGREAVQAQVQGGMDQGLAKVEIETVEVRVHEDNAWSRGTFKTMDADGNVTSEGKWVNISKWADGKWMVHLDIWNMDAPMAMPE